MLAVENLAKRYLAHGGLRRLRAHMAHGDAALPGMEQEPLLPGEMGLRG